MLNGAALGFEHCSILWANPLSIQMRAGVLRCLLQNCRRGSLRRASIGFPFVRMSREYLQQGVQFNCEQDSGGRAWHWFCVWHILFL